jgi:SAM-dependent methyltransferase
MKYSGRSVDWNTIKPIHWYNAVYVEKFGVMKNSVDDQITLLQKILSPEDAMIEMGCGSAEMNSYFCDQLNWSVGIELSPEFIKFAKKKHPKMQQKNAFLIEGDMFNAHTLLKNQMPKDFWKCRHVVTLLMNTMGLMPKTTYSTLVNTMLSIAAPQGLILIGCWNRKYLARAITDFYQRYTELCGAADQLQYDLNSGDVYNEESGYRTHWFTHEELFNLLHKQLPQQQVKIIENGVNLFGVVDFSEGI